MIVYPAIDIRDGRVVRLLHGDPTLESVYSDNPVAMARRWRDAGAEWLHVISLDGALGKSETALETLRDIAETGLNVQFGGGVRSFEAVQQAIDAGAKRVVLGTLLVNDPDLAVEAVEQFGAEAVVVALDTRGKRVATHGWQSMSEWTPVRLGKRLAHAGIRHALYTDVTKDGDLSGVNVETTCQIAISTGLEVIASGGVASLKDIETLRKAECIAGVIIGRALYAGIFTLEAALAAAVES